MSVFRRGHKPGRVDHLTLISGATGPEEVAMITYALTMNQPVLASLEGAPAIIKPFEPGDELQSYDALYDSCITAGQYRRMRKAKVKTVEDLPLRLYEVELKLDVDLSNPGCTLRLRAANSIDGRRRLEAILATTEFRVEFAVHVMRKFIQLIGDDAPTSAGDHVDVLVGGLLKVDELPPADTPDWRIIPDDDA
jgi:hypothetical protein